ncbi:tyrosine-type recombinase/integrase [Marisediminicola sp. LYQ85]|uniref:tyrosine-type recombinase/integrase n=1 Tax=Marisediminicola sp. LYQ85 TaxID=3391062 RepID=UPI003982F067
MQLKHPSPLAPERHNAPHLDPRIGSTHFRPLVYLDSERAQLRELVGSFISATFSSHRSLVAKVLGACGRGALVHMSEYTPRLAPQRWEPIADFVRDAVAVTAPQTSYTSNRIFLVLSLYVDWAVNIVGLPMTTKVLFRRETIAMFIARPPRELGEGTLRNYRSMLLRVAEVLLPEHNATAMKPLNGRTSVAPYTEKEEEQLRLWAAGQNTDLRRRRAKAMIAFCGGAGLRAAEIAELNVGDVIFDGGALVTVTGTNAREVPMLAEWAGFAHEALHDMEPDAPVFGTRNRNSHKNLLSRFTEKTSGPIRPRSDQLRATWIVKHLTAGTPMKELMRAAGVEKFENLARHLQYVPSLDTADYRRRLRLEAGR